MLVLIDNYDSFTFNLVQYLGDIGVECHVIRNDKMSVADILAMQPQALVLSPGPATPDHAGICLDLIASTPPTLPILGVCLGHQSIGQAFGGRIIKAPEIVHGKVGIIHHNECGLFKGLTNPVHMTRYHSLVIDDASVPECLRVTAKTSDGLIMAVEHVSRPIFGVQFHPESIASPDGHQLLANFLEHKTINVHNVKN